MNQPTKRCKDCGNDYPATTEYFHKMKGIYLQSYCKSCCSIRNVAYYANNADKAKAAAKEWCKSNPDKVKASLKKWYQANKDRVKQATKHWAANNREKTRGYKRQWEQRNLEQVKANREKWRLSNPDKVRLKTERHRKNNPEKYRLYAQKRFTLKKALPYAPIDTDHMLTWFDNSCAYCDCKLEKYHLDHFIPLTDPKCPGTIPSNIVPACPSCNSSKSNKPPLEWLMFKLGNVMGKIRYDVIQEYLSGF